MGRAARLSSNLSPYPLSPLPLTAPTFGTKRAYLELSMFLGLMKYYRQTYMDLLDQSEFDEDYLKICRVITDRVFDRIEIGFCVEWNKPTESKKTKELQANNRNITNEKNKYLTIFETMRNPVILLDEHNKIENMNHAWAELFEDSAVPGSLYYLNDPAERRSNKISSELISSLRISKNEAAFEEEMETKKGLRSFQVRIKRMQDISEKYKGTVIILSDITSLKKAAENELKKEKLRGVLELAGAVCHEINQPLQVVLGQSQLLAMEAGKNSSLNKRAKTITEQVERLGAITEKLSHIARYETKAYLDSKIIDIDKASVKKKGTS